MRIHVLLLIIVGVVTSSNAGAATEIQLRHSLAYICARVSKIADEETKRECARYSKHAPAGIASKEMAAEVESLHPFVNRQIAAASPPSSIPPSPANDVKRLFVRADPIDNFWYSVSPPGDISGAKGASVSYTNNQLNHTQTATINGEISYLLIPPDPKDLDKWGEEAFAVWIAANGTWNNPLKKPENTALQFGFDEQLRTRTHDPLSESPVRYWDNYFDVSPYFQTDFRQIERAAGATFAWEPVIPELLLGASKANDYLLAFWIFRPEADLREVWNPGDTSQRKGTYEWLGYTVRGNLQFFPLPTGSTWFDAWIVNRFVVIGTAQNFWDANSSKTAFYYTALLQYNLGTCTFPKNPDPGVYSDCKIAGGASISFEFDHGTNKDTLVSANQYLVKLSYKY
jgi:hypothetical protein